MPPKSPGTPDSFYKPGDNLKRVEVSAELSKVEKRFQVIKEQKFVSKEELILRKEPLENASRVIFKTPEDPAYQRRAGVIKEILPNGLIKIEVRAGTDHKTSMPIKETLERMFEPSELTVPLGSIIFQKGVRT